MPAPPARPRAARGRLRARVLCTAAASVLALGALLRGSRGLASEPGEPGRGLQAGAAAAALADGSTAAKANASAALEPEPDWSHPLFLRVDHDLRPFREGGGITLIGVEQAYCQGSRGSFRLQVVNGSAYVVGESPSYESRLLNIKLQLLPLYLAGHLPEGLDVVIEQEDRPTVPRSPSADCPTPGPLIAPAKQPTNISHSHVLLAPDHSFRGWLEAKTLAWADMLPLLRRAADQHPWKSRSPRLFFRGAATGQRNLTDPALSERYPGLLDVKLVNWTSAENATQFVSLAEHCAHKLLLHLEGNSYAGRLKYLLLCGAAVVMPESSWQEFYYHLLLQNRNVVMTEAVDADNRGHQLADAAQELQQDDWLAYRIGQAGAAMVQNALAPDRVQAYWRLLFRRYHELQQYNVTVPHADAVPLEQSILVPQLLNVTSRTCSLCRHTAEQFEYQLRKELGLMESDPLPPGAEQTVQERMAAAALPGQAASGAAGMAGSRGIVSRSADGGTAGESGSTGVRSGRHGRQQESGGAGGGFKA